MIEYENLKELNKPYFEEYKKVFSETLDSGWYILGDKVNSFEVQFAQYCQSKNCVGVASGLDAILLGLKVFDFPKNSEVIVASNTYIASILAIIQAGLKPVLVEPDITTYNIDVKKIEKKITSKTKAILAVHLYGKLCEMESIMQLSKKYNLKIIEDCAQAHGAKINNHIAGTFGEIGAFSFYPTKNLGAIGDGGAIVTNNDELADKLKYYRNYGSKIKYYNKYIGYNSRLDEVQGAFLSVKLKYLDTINSYKRKLADIYFSNIKSDKIILPSVRKEFIDVYHIFPIRCSKRDELKAYLLNNNIKTEIHYPVAPHLQEGYRKIFSKEKYPISESIHNSILSLPISTIHKEKDILKVAMAINNFK